MVRRLEWRLKYGFKRYRGGQVEYRIDGTCTKCYESENIPANHSYL